MQSARRHWLLVAVPVVLLMALGYVAGHSRSPTYTSESRLNVGRIDVTSQAIPGFVAGTQSLAATYSRAVDATDVLQPVAEQLGVPASALAGRVAAAPIPSSSLFRVSATGPTSNEAIELANLVTASLVKYVARVNDASPDAKRLLGEIEDASAALADARAASRAAVAQYANTPTPAINALVTRREAAQYAASIRLQTVTDAYRTSQQGISQSEIVQVLNPASSAANDKGAVTQKLLFVGLIGGLAIGLALATARANWRR
jgi:uncharacterized protein involved in exopolysaccharide biosynthesis